MIDLGTMVKGVQVSMFGWQDVIMAQERHKDLIREAQQAQLVQEALAGRKTVVWEKVKGLFSRFTQVNSATKERACPTCPAATDITI
jgi:hypothetical protein